MDWDGFEHVVGTVLDVEAQLQQLCERLFPCAGAPPHRDEVACGEERWDGRRPFVEALAPPFEEIAERGVRFQDIEGVSVSVGDTEVHGR